jgi:hypothetical protein
MTTLEKRGGITLTITSPKQAQKLKLSVGDQFKLNDSSEWILAFLIFHEFHPFKSNKSHCNINQVEIPYDNISHIKLFR